MVTLCTVSPGSRGDGACMRHALLGGAEEPLLDGYLACDLPGLAVGDALAVACAIFFPIFTKTQSFSMFK